MDAFGIDRGDFVNSCLSFPRPAPRQRRLSLQVFDRCNLGQNQYKNDINGCLRPRGRRQVPPVHHWFAAEDQKDFHGTAPPTQLSQSGDLKGLKDAPFSSSRARARRSRVATSSRALSEDSQPCASRHCCHQPLRKEAQGLPRCRHGGGAPLRDGG